MDQAVAGSCEFETARLRVGPWHSLANEAEIDLEQVVAGMLTGATTQALPDTWHGDFSVERSRAWINERDRESPTLLVVDHDSSQPLGLVILFGLPADKATIDLRIGYLFAESAWGQGLATELVTGLVHWARSQPSIRTLIGGVARTNPASARVLVKNGFSKAAELDDGEVIYELSLNHRTELDQ